MSVILTKDTVGKSASEFIRDVLRSNLTDTQTTSRQGSEWIFDSHEDEFYVKSNLPRVYIEESNDSMERLAPNVRGPVDITLNIEVWNSGIGAKDAKNQMGDEIGKILSDNTYSDGTTTIKDNHLRVNSIVKSNDDMISDDVLIRIKKLTISLKYYGS